MRWRAIDCCLLLTIVATTSEARSIGDMQAVGSLRREVRQEPPATRLVATEVSDLLAAAPSAKLQQQQQHHGKKHKNISGKSNEGGFYKQFGSDADGEKGYLKKSYSDGSHGYKNYDTFHKTTGDRYGFEEHEETGKQSAAADSDHQHQQQQQQHKRTKKKRKHDAGDDHEGAGTDDVESYYSGEGGDYSGYSEGGGDDGGGGGGESSSYSGGSGDGYSESYFSGDDGGGGGGDGEAYSSGESYASSGESDGSYY